jgi:hypothetical protein
MNGVPSVPARKAELSLFRNPALAIWPTDEAAHPVERDGDVRSIEDGLMDVGERHVGETGRVQVHLHSLTVGERERVGILGSDRRFVGSSRDPRIAISHSFRSGLCQTIITSLPVGPRACPMLPNAATGLSKNIVPNLLMTTWKFFGGKRWTCASATSKVTLLGLPPRRVLGHDRSRALTGRRPARCRPRRPAPLHGSSARSHIRHQGRGRGAGHPRHGAALRCAAATRRRSRSSSAGGATRVAQPGDEERRDGRGLFGDSPPFASPRPLRSVLGSLTSSS